MPQQRRLYQHGGVVNRRFVNIQSGLTKGSNQITVSNAAGFTVGRGGEILQDDIEPPAASWARTMSANGQDRRHQRQYAHPSTRLCTQITARAPTPASADPLHRTGGIEDLHIERLSSGSEGESNITITMATTAWIRRIESEWSERYHFAIAQSLYLEIRDSYIHHAYYRGDGGQGYGVSLGRRVTSVLMENNIFNELRHAMIVQIV